jgi:predicted outer membrane repeat protein
VLVWPGVYYENIQWPETNGIKLIGVNKENCIIDGGGTSSVITYQFWGVFQDSTNVIKNFTIQNGAYTQGAGIRLTSENQFILENLIIKDNHQHGAPNSDFTKNGRYFIEGGGGIALDNNSSPIIRNVQIINNSAEYDGAGLFAYENSKPTLTNVLIANNNTSTSGGGIACECLSAISLTNVSIINNTSIENGGGVFIYSGPDTSVRSVNSIFWNNLPEEIYFSEDGSISNFVTISYSDIQGGEEGIVLNEFGVVNWLEGNIDDEPMFVDFANNDFHLLENSPCIDAGDPNYPLDPDGTISDMGAYYYNQLTDIDDTDIQIQRLKLTNYPNPFNPTTTIEFSIRNNSHVELLIYNIKGQKIKSLSNKNFTKGSHSVIWNGDNKKGKSVSSGIYYYQLKVNGKTEAIEKCLLLK